MGLGWGRLCYGFFTMPRQARIDAPGALHHIIVRGIERRKIFNDDKDRYDFLSRLGDILEQSQTGCYAWAQISNHLLCGAPHNKIVFYHSSRRVAPARIAGVA
jgi:putative transposase